MDVATTDGVVKKTGSDWESDGEMDPVNWQKLFQEDELRNLQPHEKKRQDVINGNTRNIFYFSSRYVTSVIHARF